MRSVAREENVHLFVLIHGLWGNPSHMLAIENAVKRSFALISHERVVSIKPSSFRFWKTYDGIERCAENTIADILFEIETLKLKNMCHVHKISLIGYSLGGLIARYAVGSLYKMGFFNEVQPVFFCTFATPHVGVHFFKDTVFDKAANCIGKRLFGRTGHQLFLADKERLLVKMTKRDSSYVIGLSLFQKRILLANIKNDRSVPFFTSFITDYSPFESMNSVKIQYLEGAPPAKVNNVTVWPKFVDLKRSHKLYGSGAKYRNEQEATSILRSNIFIRYTLLFFAALILFPFYLPLIVCLSLYVSGYSILKVKLTNGPDNLEHWALVRSTVFRGGPVDRRNVELGNFKRQEREALLRQDSFKGDTSKFTKNTMENVLAAEEKLKNDTAGMIEEEGTDKNQYLKEERAVNKGPDLTADEFFRKRPNVLEESSSEELMMKLNVLQKRSSFLRIGEKALGEIPILEYDKLITKYQTALEWKTKDDVPLFEASVKLKFSTDQLTIIENLNDLKWIKIPVFHDLFNAHDSIVARRGDMRNPKGMCTIYLWTSILRTHILENETKAKEV